MFYLTDSPHMSLPPLPAELQLMIVSHLDFLDRHTIGLTSRHFGALIPPPTFDELSAFEKNAGALLHDGMGNIKKNTRPRSYLSDKEK